MTRLLLLLTCLALLTSPADAYFLTQGQIATYSVVAPSYFPNLPVAEFTFGPNSSAVKLENRCTGIVGSNPTLSAQILVAQGFTGDFPICTTLCATLAQMHARSLGRMQSRRLPWLND